MTMKDAEIRHVKMVREAMLKVLRSGRKLKMGILAREIQRDPYFEKNFTSDAVYRLAGLAVRLFESDFYRDPSDKAIALTLTARQVMRMKAEGDRQDAGPTGRPPDSTAAGRIHDALEAAEA